MLQKCKKITKLNHLSSTIFLVNVYFKKNSKNYFLSLIFGFFKMELEYVILVDVNDQEIGKMEKQEAHEKGLLHRAFSVFVFNEKKELLLQQRALTKYHSAGLWTNTCCSHPRVGETIEQAAHRRLMEEMGFDCELTTKSSFIYKASFENGLTEHEFDHILVGVFNGEINFNPTEVKNFKWITLDELASDLRQNNQNYTAWFKIIFENFQKSLS